MQVFRASERLGRFGEDIIYVKLKDDRGWVFESLNGNAVLVRVTLSSLAPPSPPPVPRNGSEGGMEDAAGVSDGNVGDGGD